MVTTRARLTDDVFHALANSTRRQTLERLGRGPASAGELAEPFDMALPSYMQHLKLLEDADLIHSCKQGRTRVYALNPDGFAPLETWLDRERAKWETRLDQLDDYLLSLKASAAQSQRKHKKKG